MSTWVEPEVWYAQLPSFHAAAAGLITATGTDHVLLVKPTYRDDWSLPGGYVEAGEFPHEACARELYEELGLIVKPDALLVVDWAPPEGKRPRAIISLTFDCGEIPADADLTLAADELDDWAFLPPQEAAARLPANVAPGPRCRSNTTRRPAAVPARRVHERWRAFPRTSSRPPIRPRIRGRATGSNGSRAPTEHPARDPDNENDPDLR